MDLAALRALALSSRKRLIADENAENALEEGEIPALKIDHEIRPRSNSAPFILPFSCASKRAERPKFDENFIRIHNQLSLLSMQLASAVSVQQGLKDQLKRARQTVGDLMGEKAHLEEQLSVYKKGREEGLVLYGPNLSNLKCNYAFLLLEPIGWYAYDDCVPKGDGFVWDHEDYSHLNLPQMISSGKNVLVVDDPSRCLCVTEMHGYQCKDARCQDVHWHSFHAISADQLVCNCLQMLESGVLQMKFINILHDLFEDYKPWLDNQAAANEMIVQAYHQVYNTRVTFQSLLIEHEKGDDDRPLVILEQLLMESIDPSILHLWYKKCLEHCPDRIEMIVERLLKVHPESMSLHSLVCRHLQSADDYCPPISLLTSSIQLLSAYLNCLPSTSRLSFVQCQISCSSSDYILCLWRLMIESCSAEPLVVPDCSLAWADKSLLSIFRLSVSIEQGAFYSNWYHAQPLQYCIHKQRLPFLPKLPAVQALAGELLLEYDGSSAVFYDWLCSMYSL